MHQVDSPSVESFVEVECCTRPPFQDNNMWHIYLKVDLNKVDGSNSMG
jgi:hypothetical protein